MGTFNLPPKKHNKVGGEPEMLVYTIKLVAESGYLNPDPLVWLLGHVNET